MWRGPHGNVVIGYFFYPYIVTFSTTKASLRSSTCRYTQYLSTVPFLTREIRHTPSFMAREHQTRQYGGGNHRDGSSEGDSMEGEMRKALDVYLLR